MKQLSILIATVIGLSAAPAFGQSTSGATAQASGDPIVKMRQEIAAARKVYSAKVAEDKKVYDDAKAVAGKERDAAIASARATAHQK